MCEISSLVSMFKVPENYADDMIREINEYVCISNKIHQQASKKSRSTNEAKNKTPKEQRLGSNHNSRYDTAEARGEDCTTQSWN